MTDEKKLEKEFEDNLKNFELKQCKLCLCSKWINKNETICNRCKENMQIKSINKVNS